MNRDLRKQLRELEKELYEDISSSSYYDINKPIWKNMADKEYLCDIDHHIRMAIKILNVVIGDNEDDNIPE